MAVQDTNTSAPVLPVPWTMTSAWLAAPLLPFVLDIRKVMDFAPVPCGVKVTLKVALAPTARVVEPVDRALVEKSFESPLCSETTSPVIVAVPLLVMVIVFAELFKVGQTIPNVGIVPPDV